jgi:very-short-patch-repair endonuclease/DNA-directed RNA polymerase subunit L
MTIQQERLVSIIEFAQQSARLSAKPAASVSQHGNFVLWEHEAQGRPALHFNQSEPDTEREIWLVVERLHETPPPPCQNELLKPWLESSQGPETAPALKKSALKTQVDEAEKLAGKESKPSKSLRAISTANGYYRLAFTKCRKDGCKKCSEGGHGPYWYRYYRENGRQHSEYIGKELPAGIENAGQADKPSSPPSDTLSATMLADYVWAADVRAAFQLYLDSKWKPWAQDEKQRRETIRLYAKLFTLRQQLEGGLVETPSELVWGVGLGVWNCEGTTVQYPLLTQAVEISLNPITSAIEISPRDVEPRLETDWYASVDNPGLAGLEKKSKEFFTSCTTTFSPFDRGTFEPLLRTAVTHLDSNGEYWPDRTWSGNRALPPAERKLRITDTWVLFARPRMNNVFVRDLENFKTKLSQDGDIHLPRAVHQVVSEPSNSNPEVTFPEFRGLSATKENPERGKKAADLYFPKPFNDEQVRILQLLEISDGVVVQGPPGTGKTHTIANVISHYLANGKRVLVTSMKEPALGVLREALPTDIQPLAISLLTSEHEGMKQFEHAIHRIASEVQSLDRQATRKEISHLEESIDGLHSKLANTDREIEKWAKANLAPICVGGEQIGPLDAAKLTVDCRDTYSWLQDELGIEENYQPQFGQEDVVRLREARRTLGKDIEYLNATLPELCDFPAPEKILQIHFDLGRLAALEAQRASGAVLEVAKNGDAFLATAEQLLADIREMRRLSVVLEQTGSDWAISLRDAVKDGSANGTFTLLQELGTDLANVMERRRDFLSRPVDIQPSAIHRDDVVLAIANLSEGRRAFGTFGFLGKSEQKKLLEEVRVLGSSPQSSEDWKHVVEFIDCQQSLQQLAIRWNALADELGMECVGGSSPEDGLAAAKLYRVVENVSASVKIEVRLKQSACDLVPLSRLASDAEASEDALEELERVLQHHLAKNRLANVWSTKQKMLQRLEGKTGDITGRLQDFVAHILGDATVSQSDLQRLWSDLLQELCRIHGLRSHLETVKDVTERVEASGAKLWAEALRLANGGTTDSLLPDNWQLAWKYRRIATYLYQIDQQERLHELSSQRKSLEAQLAKAYKDIVVKRTWLKLAENASPKIRTALQAYLNAIQKIGKGTGKRAVRYRQDARLAAEQANPAVPCWILSHYRVSESIPCELGCFDLVIIDEASQSDLTALPALLRAEKVLIVGDDKQVSPDAVGLEEEKVRSLMQRFLGNQVPTVRAQLSPDRSIYDLFKVVFASSTVMLKEHFRCVAPIIEYSKREFYNHELRPLRRPKLSERLDPPLIDVVVEDGFRRGDVNLPEARFIVDEIKRLIEDPNLRNHSIGVVSLLGDKQALEIWQKLTDEVGPEVMERHRIACGDARTFQGKERSIMFLSMVCAPSEGRIAPLVRDTFAQRFNVAASRAQDRMYLVRSVELEHLSEADRLRRSLISHFSSPFMRDEVKVEDLRKLCESPFECEVYDCLTERGYCVTPQVHVGQYRIDMVVEGANDARLAIECDGDRYHGPDKWAEDTQRQRVLERAGWVFWRCFASAWIRRRNELLQDLLANLAQVGIEPTSGSSTPKGIYTEQRRVTAVAEKVAAATAEV